MNKPSLTFKNEHGSTIIVAMLILVFLTIIGISAVNTSRFEAQIVGNEHRYQIDFYLADSGWKEAGMWLEGLAGPPDPVNAGNDGIVKNFGFGTPGTTNESDPPPSDLSVLTADNFANSAGIRADNDGIDNDGDGQIDEAGELYLSQYGISYWYQIQYTGDSTDVGSNKSLRRFSYSIASNANRTQVIQTRASKLYKVGY